MFNFRYTTMRGVCSFHRAPDVVISARVPFVAQSNPTQCYRFTRRHNTWVVMATSSNERLAHAARRGDAVKVEQLLKDDRANCAEYVSGCLWIAAEFGHVRVVEALVKDRRANPADRGSFALFWAAVSGNGETVKLLLEDGRANPADRDSRALRLAASRGHARVVKAILMDSRADPTCHDSEALWNAIRGGHTEVVTLLVRAIPRHKRWNRRWQAVHVMLHVSIYFDPQ